MIADKERLQEQGRIGRPYLFRDAYSRAPPPTGKTSPVIQAESSDARKTATLAISCGAPTRPRGVRETASSLNSSLGSTRRARAFGLHQSGRQGVDANVLRTQFLRQRAGDDIHRALGSAIHRSGGRRREGRDRTQVDDRATVGHRFDRRLGAQQGPQDVEIEHAAIAVFGDFFQRSELVHARIVDQDIDRSKRLGRSRRTACPRRLSSRRRPAR